MEGLRCEKFNQIINRVGRHECVLSSSGMIFDTSSLAALVSNIIGPGKIVEDRLFLGVQMKK